MNLQRLFLPLAALTALAAFVGAAATATEARTKAAGGPINALAMDGANVAFDVGNSRVLHGVGNKVLVWNVLTGKTTTVSGPLTSQADVTSTGRGVRELAIAGGRVAWIVNQGGNTESADYLYTSSVTTPKERRIAKAVRHGDESSSVMHGTWIGSLVGSGDVIAVDRWTTGADGAVTKAELDVVGTRGLQRVASDTEVLFARAAAADRVAVVRSDGTVAVYSSAGKELHVVTPSSTQLAALRGHYLVVLTKTRKLEVYDSRTGVLLNTLSARGGRAEPKNLDVQAPVAVYTVGAELHVVNLKTGRDVVLARLKRGILFAQIEAPGVVYAGNVPNGGAGAGTLVYVPIARVAAAVS